MWLKYLVLVVIRFQICIFDILNTAIVPNIVFALVVVIRFQICIFDILNTAIHLHGIFYGQL